MTNCREARIKITNSQLKKSEICCKKHDRNNINNK